MSDGFNHADKPLIPGNQFRSRTVSLGHTAAAQTQTTPHPFPNLGIGGTLVTAFVSSFFAAQIVCDLTVLLLYGRHAFFDQGLRVADWKHSILSNGVHLPWYGTLMIGPTILPVCAAALFSAEFVAKRVRDFLAQHSRWLTATARLLGGAALLALSVWFYSLPKPFPPVHPVPLSALIAGSILTWKAFATPFR